MAASGNLRRPLGQHVGELPGVLVVARHVDSGLGALHILLKFLSRGRRVIFLKSGQRLRGSFAALKPRGAEEHDGVLDLLAAEAGQRLLVFGQHAQDASVRAVEKRLVLIGNGSGLQVICHA